MVVCVRECSKIDGIYSVGLLLRIAFLLYSACFLPKLIRILARYYMTYHHTSSAKITHQTALCGQSYQLPFLEACRTSSEILELLLAENCDIHRTDRLVRSSADNALSVGIRWIVRT